MTQKSLFIPHHILQGCAVVVVGGQYAGLAGTVIGCYQRNINIIRVAIPPALLIRRNSINPLVSGANIICCYDTDVGIVCDKYVADMVKQCKFTVS